MAKHVSAFLCLFFLVLAATSFLYAQTCVRDGLRDISSIMVGFGALAFVLAVSLPVLRAHLKKRPPGACPSCSGATIREPGFFRVMPMQRCPTCGHEWEPNAPTWLLAAGMIIALLAIALGSLMLYDSRDISGWIRGAMLVAGGSIAMRGCLTRLARKQEM